MTTLHKEVRSFKLHNNVIYQLIKSQASSLDHAFMECVMNAADAFATEVRIELTPTGFVIRDNGIGFKSKDEIKAWFETLGFPHEIGNHRQFGKFGLGRAQLWAYAKTEWESNQFRMTVDVQNNGLDYDLATSPTAVQGTIIRGEFYDPMRVIFHAQSFCRKLKYFPIPVYLNREKVNQDLSSIQWTLETDDVYILQSAKNSGDVDGIYNQGVFVQLTRSAISNLTGSYLIVTKPGRALEVNISRNEVLRERCELWPKIEKMVRDLDKALKDKQKKNPSTAHLSKGMPAAYNIGRHLKVQGLPCIGRTRIHFVGLQKALLEGAVLAAADVEQKNVALKLARTKRAIVFNLTELRHETGLENIGSLTLVEALRSELSKFLQSRNLNPWVPNPSGEQSLYVWSDLEAVLSLIVQTPVEVDENELTPQLQGVVKALTEGLPVLLGATGYSLHGYRVAPTANASALVTGDFRQHVFLIDKSFLTRLSKTSGINRYPLLRELMVGLRETIENTPMSLERKLKLAMGPMDAPLKKICEEYLDKL